MELPRLTAGRMLILSLSLTLLANAAHAQETARIKLESLDRLAAKATETVRKDEKAAGGDSMVYVRCFEFKEPGDYTEADLHDIRAQLKLDGWSRFMRVDDKDPKPAERETTEIYVFGRMDGSDVFAGMTIISTQPKELTVVNIVGQGKVDDISKQAGQAKSQSDKPRWIR